MTTRYFIVSLLRFNELNQPTFSHLTIKQKSFPSLLQIKEFYNTVNITILNIMEISEIDFLEFNKKEK